MNVTILPILPVGITISASANVVCSGDFGYFYSYFPPTEGILLFISGM